MKISVVIPCHNEALSIGNIIKSIGNEVHEIIVVDNNCTDATALLAQAAGAKVIRESRPGYGAAIRSGIAVATGDTIAVLDGDGQYPAEKIVELAPLLEQSGSDFISCARFPLQSKASMTRVRLLGNYFFNFAIRALFAIRLKDSQSGMWIFKKNLLEKISLESSGMAFSEELKIKAIASGARFKEVPIAYYPRHKESVSKLSPLMDGLGNLFYLLKLSRKLQPAKLGGTKMPFFVMGVIGAVALYILLSLYKIKAPFIYAGLDVNVWNGLAASNWLRFGALRLMFGNYPSQLASAASAFGHFYTHHPPYYLFFPYLFYALFGVSEWTTRAGIVAFMAVSLLVFGYALKQFFKSTHFAVLTVLILAMLPGVVFYGQTLELSIFSIPASILTYSFYLLYRASGKKRHLSYFLISILFGGLMGWFYFFMPISIWLFIFVRKDADIYRKKLLYAIPLLLACATALTLINFYIINGNIFSDLLSVFMFRSARIPIGIWLKRVFYFTELHCTWLFLCTSFAGFIVLLQLRATEAFKERYVFLIPLIFSPLFMAGILTQWFTHPFGAVFLCLPVAVLSAFLFTIIINKLKFVGVCLTAIMLCCGLALSWQHLQFYFSRFRLVGERDALLLQTLRPQLNDNELCVDLSFNDPVGLVGDITPVLTWYFVKQYVEYPQCLQAGQDVKVLLLSEYTLTKMGEPGQDLMKKNWVESQQLAGEWWSVWVRKQAASTAQAARQPLSKPVY